MSDDAGAGDLPDIEWAALPDRLKEAAGRAGWSDLMPVQRRAIPYLLAGRDVMVQARTGSGKTGAFVLPMLERLDASRRSCQALVLVPTRELAQQVGRDATQLAGDVGVRVIAAYGGTAYGAQLAAFKQGAHIVVGTPGRILDHLLRRSLRLDDLRMLVFDEADRMLSMGFYPDMKRIERYLPDRRLNVSMFSATYPVAVLSLARQFLTDPETLSLSRDHVHVTETAHRFYTVPAMDKDRCLVRIIEVENPGSALIFSNTKVRVHYLSEVLQRFGYDADELSADLGQRQRERVLGRVREGSLRFLVATDVAARGIDIPELSHVIQYEPPEDPEDYIHRAGRTGRAGASGTALTLVAGVEMMRLKNIARQYSIDLKERPLPSEEDVATLVAERVTALLEARLRECDSLQKERLQRFVPLARGLGQIEDEAELVAMLLDEFYQQTLHAPPPQPEAAAVPPPREERRPRRGRGGRRGRRR